MAPSSFQPPTPQNLTADDKARVDQDWQDALHHFKNDFTFEEDDFDKIPLEEYIAGEVERAYFRGKYGEDAAALVPQVNRTVNKYLERWVQAPGWFEELNIFSKGENAKDRAKWEYVRSYKAEYKRRWLSEHQRITNEGLKDLIRFNEEEDGDGDSEPDFDDGATIC